MKNGFPYFQFHVDRWLAGKVAAFDLEEQGLFLHFVMLAWTGQGAFNVCSTTVQRRFKKTPQWLRDTISAFLDVGILMPDATEGLYHIKFIDEQLADLCVLRGKRSHAGKVSAEVRSLSSSKERIEEKSIQEKSSVLNCVEQTFNKCSTPATASKGDLNRMSGQVPDKSGQVPDPSASASASESQEGDARGESAKGDLYTSPLKVGFDEFWSAYPKKVGKKAAVKAWAKATDKPGVQEIIGKINELKATKEWQKDGGQFIPHPATWLNEGRWDDAVKVDVSRSVTAETFVEYAQ